LKFAAGAITSTVIATGAIDADAIAADAITAAKIAAGVTLRVVGVDGNGAVDPAFGNIAAILT